MATKRAGEGGQLDGDTEVGGLDDGGGVNDQRDVTRPTRIRVQKQHVAGLHRIAGHAAPVVHLLIGQVRQHNRCPEP